MFFRKKKKEDEEIVIDINTEEEEKPTPAYLREDYPYKTIGEAITDLDSLIPNELYEIKCHKCEMSIRSQGQNIKDTYNRLLVGVDVENEDGSIRHDGGKGCLGCGNKNLKVYRIDTSKMPKTLDGIK